jgi:hypothetical protein
MGFLSVVLRGGTREAAPYNVTRMLFSLGRHSVCMDESRNRVLTPYHNPLSFVILTLKSSSRVPSCRAALNYVLIREVRARIQQPPLLQQATGYSTPTLTKLTS